ncbi:MAG: type II toxin-antitoxin system HicB family antitoxin [Candidatus Limnocylindria bacterium]
MTAKRVLISIDERLLARIDQAVERRGLTRSGYLAQLASTDLEASRGPGADPAVVSSLRAIDDPFTERE